MSEEGRRRFKQLRRRVAEAIRAAMPSRIGEPELAAVVGYCVQHLNKLFVEHSGESFGKYVSRVHHEHATVKLSTTNVPVKVIAQEAGYGSTEAFGRSYVKRYGATPSQIREWNPGMPRPMPGHLLLTGQLVPESHYSVGLVLPGGYILTTNYDGDCVESTLHPDGRVDIRPGAVAQRPDEPTVSMTYAAEEYPVGPIYGAS